MFPTVDVLMPVRIREPKWQTPMTQFAMDAMRRCTDVPFRFVVMETVDDGDVSGLLSITHAVGADPLWKSVDHHEVVKGPHTFVEKLNLGLAKCTADFVVHTANDIFVRPGWLEAMLEVFEKIPDAGVATLASSDLPAPLSTRVDAIMEGVYGPHMMFRRCWGTGRGLPPEGNWRVNREVSSSSEIPEKRFDRMYENIFSDTDLIFAHYAAGLRSYRNHRVVIDHLNRATMNGIYTAEQQARRMEEAKGTFMRKYKAHSHIRVFQYLATGLVV